MACSPCGRMRRLALLCAAATAVAGLEVHRPGSSCARLLSLRGGLEPQVAVPRGKTTPKAAARTAAVADKVSAKTAARAMKKKRKKGGGAGVMLLDVATAMGVLAVVAGAQLASPLVDTLPKEAQGVAWMGFGGSLIAGLYLLVSLFNRRRARALCGLLFGDGVFDSWLQHALPAAFFALGSVGSMLTLPEGAG